MTFLMVFLASMAGFLAAQAVLGFAFFLLKKLVVWYTIRKMTRVMGTAITGYATRARDANEKSGQFPSL